MSEPPAWQSIAGLSMHGSTTTVLRNIQTHERYRREGLIGAGGMGRVYLAYDQHLNRFVALKEAAADGPLSEALSREARITAALDHPGIVAVHDAGTSEQGRPYYAMRLVRGRSLELILEAPSALSARLPLLTHFRDACQAIAFAHAQGIVHRDIKPANLLLGEFGETQVVDWGLALPLAEVPAEVVGSPAWIAPEQARGEAADLRTDVWGLGAVLYHLLTGHPPYPDGLSAASTLGRVPAIPPGRAPAELIAIVDKALQPDPSQRYPDAKALAQDIEAYLVGERVTAHAYTPWELLSRLVSAWKAPLSVAALALLVGAGLTLEAGRRLTLERNRAVAAEADAKAALAASLAASAHSAILAGAEGEATRLAAQSLALTESPLARGAWVATQSLWPLLPGPTASLDACPNAQLFGEALLCRTATALWLQHGPTTRWHLDLALVTVTPAGPTLVGQDGSTGHLIDSQTGKVLTRFSQPTAGLPLVGTPDGRYASRRWEGESWSGDPRPGQRTQHALCQGHGTPRESTLHASSPAFASWCADGSVGLADAQGQPHHFTLSAPLTETGDAAALTFSPDGAELAIAYHNGRLALLDLHAGTTRWAQLRSPAGFTQLRFSPDGATLATIRENGTVELWHTPTLTLVASPPLSHARSLAWDSPTTLRVLGEQLTQWSLQPSSTLPTHPHALGIRSASFAPGGAHVLTAHADGVGQLWALHGHGHATTLHFGRGTLMSAPWLDAQHLIGVSGETLEARTFDLNGRQLSVTPLSTLYRTLVPQPGGSLVGLRFDGVLEHFDTQGATFPIQCEARTWVAERDGWLLALDGTVVRLHEAQCSPPVPGLNASRIAGDATTLYAHGPAGLQRLHPTGEAVWTAPLAPELALDLAASPDGRWLAAGGLDRAIRVYNARSGALVAQFPAHDKRVSSVAFSPDSAHLLSGSWDGSAKLWRTAALTGTAAP